MPLKSIFVVGISWKITQVKQKLTWLTLVRSEEDNPLGSLPTNISLHELSLWGLSKYLLLLGLIFVSKWGLRPNIKVQAFAPTLLILNIWLYIMVFDYITNFKYLLTSYSSMGLLVFPSLSVGGSLSKNHQIFFFIKIYIYKISLLILNK